MVSSLPPPLKSGSLACKLVLTSSLRALRIPDILTPNIYCHGIVAFEVVGIIVFSENKERNVLFVNDFANFYFLEERVSFEVLIEFIFPFGTCQPEKREYVFRDPVRFGNFIMQRMIQQRVPFSPSQQKFPEYFGK